MVNFNDPTLVLNDILALKSFYLVTVGIYLWEFFTTFDYEFSIIRGRRPYRKTIWIYSFTRFTALVMVSLNLMFFNARTPINCQMWIKFQVLCGYLSIVSASLLVVIRIIAIWNKNKIAVTIASSVWVTNVVTAGMGISRLHSNWDVVTVQCIVVNSESSKLNIIVLLVTDIVLFLTMLVGLLRLRGDGIGTYGVGQLLWKQGILWLLVATVAEVPPAVFIILNLNGPFNLMFQLPSVITLSIAATRMYRSLTDFDPSTSTTVINSKVPKLRWIQTPFNRIHVTVDTSNEQDQASQISHHDSCILNKEEQSYDSDKSNGPELQQQSGERVEDRVGLGV